MRKFALAAGLVALAAATPALAEGKGVRHSEASYSQSKASPQMREAFGHIISNAWRRAFATPPGFSSPGRHSGWFRGKHWGWFKPKHPHWPHDPPVSP